MPGSKQYSKRLPIKRYERSLERPVEKIEEEFGTLEEVTVHTDITSNPGNRNTTGIAGIDRNEPADNATHESCEVNPDVDSNTGSGLVMGTGLKKIRKKKPKKHGKLG